MENIEIQNLIKDLLEKATIPVKEITIVEKDGNGGSSKTTWFSVETNHPYHLIGRGGDALFALNHLVKKIVEAKNISKNGVDLENLPMNNIPAILVDVNGFQQKRNMAHNISNEQIEAIYLAAKKAGATGGKISGAGGGGFMTFYCPGNTRYKVIETLNSFGGVVRPYQVAQHGLTSWTTQ